MKDRKVIFAIVVVIGISLSCNVMGTPSAPVIETVTIPPQASSMLTIEAGGRPPTPTAIVFPPGESPIDIKYEELGGETGLLGAPKDDEKIAPDNIGHYRHFQNGSIYWSPETGAWEVHGFILGKWAELGWEFGILGYPVSDEIVAEDGIGRYSHFQRGSIYWTPDTGAWEVHGHILTKWNDLGGIDFLGYPVSDELVAIDDIGRYSNFQKGSIYWTPDTGAWEVHGVILETYLDVGGVISCLGYPISDEAEDTTGEFTRVSHFQHGVIRWSSEKGAIETCN
jgi:uncharacterized protein with LGFP repeats